MNPETFRKHQEDNAKAYHKRVELISAIKVEYTLRVKLKVINSWSNDLEVRDLERMIMSSFTQDRKGIMFNLSSDIYTYGIITVTAKTQSDLMYGVDYIESILGNSGEVVLA